MMEAENSNGHMTSSDPGLEVLPLRQTLLKQLVSFIGSTALSEQEKSNDMIHEQMRNALRKEVEALRQENEDGKTRNGELEQLLGERDAQLAMNAVQMETLQTQLIELQRTNTDLHTRNQELEAFHSNLLHVFHRQPTVGSSSAGSNPLVQDAPAAVHTETLAPPVVNSVPVVMEAAKIELPRSTQSWMGTPPPALPVLAALLPQSPLPTPLDISFDSTASDVLAAPTPSASATDAALASPELFTGTEPESPELARPKKKVTFSPHPPEVRTIQPGPVAMGKRKRNEPLMTVNVCKVCLVEYDSQRDHVCYHCGFAGCGETFKSLSSKRRHEKSHTENDDGNEQRTSRTPTTSRFH